MCLLLPLLLLRQAIPGTRPHSFRTYDSLFHCFAKNIERHILHLLDHDGAVLGNVPRSVRGN